MNKVSITSSSITFSNSSGITKIIKRSDWTGTAVEIPTWGDFDTNYFQLAGNKIQYLKTPPTPSYNTLFNGTIGNQEDKTITFCAIPMQDEFTKGNYFHALTFQKKSASWYFPIKISYYCDTYGVSDVQTFFRSDGKPNGIAVGQVVKGNDNFFIIAPYEDYDTYVIQSTHSYPKASTTVINYEPTPTSYL